MNKNSFFSSPIWVCVFFFANLGLCFFLRQFGFVEQLKASQQFTFQLTRAIPMHWVFFPNNSIIAFRFLITTGDWQSYCFWSLVCPWPLMQFYPTIQPFRVHFVVNRIYFYTYMPFQWISIELGTYREMLSIKIDTSYRAGCRWIRI